MIDPARLKKLLRRLIDIYSPSGKETDILDFLRSYLRRRGMPVTMQPVDDERYNLLVLPESGIDAQVALVGHLDTVSAYDLARFECQEKGDRISGLGAADMKSGCAAMIEAFCAFRGTGGGNYPAALCLLVGEEETGDGAASLVREYHFPWAVVGEPTDLKPCLASYGYIEMEIEAVGRRLHASMASPKRNAIEVLLRRMIEISRFLEAGYPQAVYNIRDMFSSKAGFAVPERCEAWMDVHLPPHTAMGNFIAELEEVAGGKLTDGSRVDIGTEIVTIDDGYELPERGALVEILRNVYPALEIAWSPDAFRSHSDANRLWAAGIKPVVLGPGQLEEAHTEEESVSFDQVLLATRIYRELLQRIT